jgi:type I site-specific restriction endonuclease
MSVFNKAKLTNLRKRIEKEYDLEQCPFAQRILDTIAECYDECCDDRDAELRKEKAEYLGEYRHQDVECECGKQMLLANIYEHHKFACPLRHRPKKPTYEKCGVSRKDLHYYTKNMEWIEEYGENKKKGKKNLTEEELMEWWNDLKELATKMERPVGVFKKRMKTEYNLDLP